MPEKNYNRSLFVIVACVLLVLILAFAKPALSHEWFTHKRDPVTNDDCCNGTDCKPIADDRWWQDGNEYVVRWLDNIEYRIPVKQAQPSQDLQGRAAGCVWGGKLRCFFLPVSG